MRKATSIGVMTSVLFAVLAYARAFLMARHRLAMEVAALRQQLAVYKRKQPRPRRAYIAYYDSDRTHIALNKSTPAQRAVEHRLVVAVISSSNRDWVVFTIGISGLKQRDSCRPLELRILRTYPDQDTSGPRVRLSISQSEAYKL